MLFEQVNISIAGEDALIVYFADSVSGLAFEKIQWATDRIRENMAESLVDLIPSYTSILVVFDVFVTDHHSVRKQLRSLLQHSENYTPIQAKVIELPIYYGLEAGPDLQRIADKSALTIEEVIKVHQAQEYMVFAIGFAPGFAYLGEVDKSIAMPRLSTPRLSVPKGAVAIADRQTAIYPSVSPGGWNIIGLCPIDMFDSSAEPCMPVKVGDKVKFTAISRNEYLALGGKLAQYEEGE